MEFDKVMLTFATDSTLGKVMEKAGSLMHNENMVAKGAAKRQEAAMAEKEKEKEKPPFAN